MVARRGRESPGFNLAFLDIMSCGLGAVVLVFLLVKHGMQQPQDGPAMLTADMAASIRRAAALEQDLQQLVNVNEQADKKAGELRDAKKAAEIELAKARAENQSEEGRGKKLRQASTSLKNKQLSSPIPVLATASEQYIIGMAVTGQRIAIVLDTSSSMTDDKIVDIVRRKVRDDAVIQAGPKWQRALKAGRWLISKVPATSRYTVLTFNERAEFLAGNPNWLDGDDTATMGKLGASLSQLVPKGATNLEGAVDSLLGMTRRPDVIYLVSDGLPTRGVGSQPRLKGCKKATVSLACREALFLRAHRKLAAAGLRVNVVLLPMEGDPSAADLFWTLAGNSGGVMLSPAASWP